MNRNMEMDEWKEDRMKLSLRRAQLKYQRAQGIIPPKDETEKPRNYEEGDGIVYQQVHPLVIKAVATVTHVLIDGKVYRVKIGGLRQRSWQGNLFTPRGRAILGGLYDGNHSST